MVRPVGVNAPLPLTDDQLGWMRENPPGSAPHSAAAEIDRLRQELATPPDERSEIHWDRGYRAALTGVLGKVLGDLGYDPDALETRRASWIIEREGAIRALRTTCRDLGDNDWPVDLSLDDVIEKHLHRHFDAGRIVGTIQRLLKSLPSDAARNEALAEMCVFCGSIYLPCYCTRDE